METRSKRQQALRPAYPQISTTTVTSPPSSSSSSTASSAFQSSSSLAAYPSPRPINAYNTAQSPMYSQQPRYDSSAPLPSPLAQQPPHYFGSMDGQATLVPGHSHQIQPQTASTQHYSTMQHATIQPQQNQAQPQSQQQEQQQQQEQHQYMGQRGAGGGAPETAPFLNNFNLVAEAAKRAQMACLMRDLGEVEL